MGELGGRGKGVEVEEFDIGVLGDGEDRVETVWLDMAELKGGRRSRNGYIEQVKIKKRGGEGVGAVTLDMGDFGGGREGVEAVPLEMR